MSKLSTEEIKQIVEKNSVDAINKEKLKLQRTLNQIDSSNFNEALSDILVAMIDTIKTYTEQTVADSIAKILEIND